MKVAKAIDELIDSFQRLPGIGPKTAARLVYYLLHVPQFELDRFSQAIVNLKHHTVMCEACFNITETTPCAICASPSRVDDTIIVVEQPLDILALEKVGDFNGKYHVLHGAISPINNIGPQELKIGELLRRVEDKEVAEVILAMNNNLEGEGTALYLAQQLALLSQKIGHEVLVTRLAKGIPVGGEVEYADEITLKRALEGRVRI